MTIYKIINKINGKIYIGQTVKTLDERLQSHYYGSRYKQNSHLLKSIKKYGEVRQMLKLLIVPYLIRSVS